MDTWESLRHRSPFSVSVMMMIGKRVEDAGGTFRIIFASQHVFAMRVESPQEAILPRDRRDNAELIGKSMVFSPVANIEALQALIVLSCWGDTVWRPGRMSFSCCLSRTLSFAAH